MVYDTKAFGTRVRLLRKGSGLTQERLAEGLYITISHMTGNRYGKRSPGMVQ